MDQIDKYYTPTFEDFIPNLEYEYFDGMKWVRKTYDKLSHRADPTMDLQYELRLRKDRFRVKYLDEEDIVKLGFTGRLFRDREIKNEELILTNHKGFRVALNKESWEEPWINVLRRSSQYFFGEEGWDTVFISVVKNKTELKRILKMLGL